MAKVLHILKSEPDETIARLIESQTVEGEAAVDNQKQVRMHLVGAGCAFVKTEACIHLSRQVPITLCAASAKTMAAQDVDRLPERIALVPPQALMRILEQCDRHVVF